MQKNIDSSDSDESHIQKSLFDEDIDLEGRKEDESINGETGCLVSRETASRMPIPKNILAIKISSSEQAPLIFWSLVALRASGYQYSSGVEITKVINSYLVGDHQKKFPNNISRALRQPSLISQPWLDIAHSHKGNRKFFGLADNWRAYWEKHFQENAPEI